MFERGLQQPSHLIQWHRCSPLMCTSTGVRQVLMSHMHGATTVGQLVQLLWHPGIAVVERSCPDAGRGLESIPEGAANLVLCELFA